MMGSQLDQSVCCIPYACNSAKKYFDIIKNDDLSSLYQEIYSKIIAQDGFLVERISFTYMYSD